MTETTYTVEVKTGHKGTNADIEIFLFGTKGTWKDFQLMDNPGIDDFEPYQTNIFTFIDDNDIGFVTDIAIRPRGPGLHHDNWKMDSIKITSDAKNSRASTFKERKRLFTGEAEPVILRSEKFADTNIVNKTEAIPVRKYIIVENNFGGEAASERSITNEIITTDSLTVVNENMTSIKQSYEIKRSASASVEGLIQASASLTFSGEIAASFKEQITKSRETQVKDTKVVKYKGLDYHCNFFVFTDYEVRVIGSFDNTFLNKTTLEQAVEKYTTVEIKSFKAVDQALPGTNQTFKELWEASSKPNLDMPTSPKLADLT